MKRILTTFILVILCLNFILAAETDTCDLDTILVNQDPYPAIPGEVVKLVFQVDGISEEICGNVEVNFIESFPFTLDPEYSQRATIQSGTYVKDFEDYWMIPYKVRVDEDALDGTNTLDLSFKTSQGISVIEKEFEVEVKDLRTDFEITIDDYNSKTGILIFQILNIGENDVEALTVDIPSQENIEVKGTYRNIVGSIDSNDDTTFSFEAKPKDGDIKLIITYTDEINERRTMEKIVPFDSNLFNGRAGEEESRSIWFYVTLIIAVVWVFMWYRKRKHKKRHTSH